MLICGAQIQCTFYPNSILTPNFVPNTFHLDKEGTGFMEAFDVAEINSSVPLPVLASGDSRAHADGEAIHLRALRRRARRISAYARFNVDALTTLALQVESDIAALQH